MILLAHCTAHLAALSPWLLPLAVAVVWRVLWILTSRKVAPSE